MKTYKHIVFDIDGTLLDTEKAILHSLKDVLREALQEDVPMKELKFVLGIPGETALRQLGIQDTGLVGRKWNERLSDYKSEIRLFDGIPELLSALKGHGYALGIVTSKTRYEYQTDFAIPFDVADGFSTVICVEDASNSKPNPEPLLAYFERARIDARDALYIGDTVYDSQCARGAGVDFGLALWGNAGAQGIPADYRFQTPREVLRGLDIPSDEYKTAVHDSGNSYC